MTVIGSGLGGQFGCVAEVTYGTFVTPTRFLEFEKESLKANIGHIESFGIGSGRFVRTLRAKNYIKDAGGNITLNPKTKGFGLIFKHMLGSLAVAQQGGTSEYKHTATVDQTNGKAGLFMTMQVGRPDVSGTCRPYNYTGCKISEWEMGCALDQELKLDLTVDAKTEQTSDALASASYSSADDIFIFTEGAVTIGGSTVYIKSFKLNYKDGLAVDRRFLGNTKKEPLAAAIAQITGELEFEHEALTRHGQLTGGTELTNLILTFDTGSAIPSGVANFRVIVTVPLIQYVEGPPVVDGPAIVKESIKFIGLNDGSNSPVQIDYYTTDTAA